MQYFIYSMSGERKIVEDEEYKNLLKKPEWFRTPFEAKSAFKDAVKRKVKENAQSEEKADKPKKKSKAKAKDDL